MAVSLETLCARSRRFGRAVRRFIRCWIVVRRVIGPIDARLSSLCCMPRASRRGTYPVEVGCVLRVAGYTGTVFGTCSTGRGLVLGVGTLISWSGIYSVCNCRWRVRRCRGLRWSPCGWRITSFADRRVTGPEMLALIGDFWRWRLVGVRCFWESRRRRPRLQKSLAWTYRFTGLTITYTRRG